MAKIRGRISSVGYTTASFITADAELDGRWPEDQGLLQEKMPVYLAQENSFEPHSIRMLTPDQTPAMADLSRRYRQFVRDRADGPIGNYETHLAETAAAAA